MDCVLKNASWREYYDKAPSDSCRKAIEGEFVRSLKTDYGLEYEKEKLEAIFDKAVANVTENFRTNVFDFQKMIEDLSKINFKKMLTENLRSAAKAASVTLANEALSKLSEHFDLALEAEEAKATGHVIDTQAIAGAGARDVGVAGSVAITVLNANESEFAEGKYLIIATVDKKQLKVFEDLVKEKDEKAFIMVSDTKSYVGGYFGK